MKKTIKKLVLKTLKITGIVFGSIILLMFLLPYLFPQAVNRKITQWANGNINGQISLSKTRLSFFKHFPSLTLTLYDVTLKGSAPFENDTLIAAQDLSFGIDVPSIFKSKITINKVFLSDALINIQVDSLGRANYNIYKPKLAQANTAPDTSSASLGINKIIVKNSRLVYRDMSLPMVINARGFNYSGSGNLSEDVFELNTHTEIQSLDFYYGNQPYILSKKINADLITEINTKSLAFAFRKNNLVINELPVEFNGQFKFIDNGYDMDLHITSNQNDLSDIISALPASYQKAFEHTTLSGTGIIQLALTGKYIAKDKTMPDLTFSARVKNGYINNSKAPVPLSNLYLDMSARLPGFNTDSLFVNIDSVHFNIGDGYFNAAFRLKGLTAPDIYARVNSEIDLEKWKTALGVKPIDVKGRYSLHFTAEGKYAKSIIHTGLRNTADTIITSIPKFALQSSFRSGYFKYGALPQAVKDISFDLVASCPDNDYKHISMALDNLNATALDNYIKGYFKLVNADNFPVDANLQAKINLADLKKVYPIDSMDLQGILNANITAKGNYLPAKKKYPVIAANISMQDGSIQTKYYPHPIENIQVSTIITDKTGSLSGLNVSVKPISFTFEGQPFALKAELNDFADLAYKINLKGTLDIGRIYQVFSKQGYNVTGTIDANLSLKGKQSDITAGHYDKISDKGSLTIKGITCTTELYPKPFVISRGVFSFKQDKIQLDTLAVKYANSTFVLNGAVSNILNYITKPGSVLKGSLSLKSKQLVIDDFMAFSTSASSKPTTATSNASTGVVLVPKNLDLDFTADIKTVKYNDMVINNAKGQMMIKGDSILLKETGFDLIGAPINMDASYTGINPTKAFFNYHISAKDFDVHKAYKNIKLFHDLVSSAAHAEGLISLDYQLSGYLNANMQPVYPSLKGGGVLSAKRVQMHGFGLFNAIGKEAKQDSLGKDAGVSKIAIKSTIANNILTIERTKIRIAIFRARLEGQVSFNKELNLKLRLGLPPLGLIGIPMTITGTEDNPKIHLGKGDKDDELAGTSDDDEKN